MRILLVEDDVRLAGYLVKAFADRDYTVDCARTCKEAAEKLEAAAPEVIALDLGLPDGDGIDLLRQWRKEGREEPVLVLSARNSLDDRVRGLDLGADDYLSKPFSVEELLARARSLLRRRSLGRVTELASGSLRLDLLSRVAWAGDRRIELTNREFALLELFLSNCGQTLSREAIAERVWGSSAGLQTNLIDVYVRKLRRRLEEGGLGPTIETTRGVGYRIP